MSALSEVSESAAKPAACPPGAHTHRMLKFGKDGDRAESVLTVDHAGEITLTAQNGAEISLPEQFVTGLVVEAGWVLADPSSVEVAAAKRLSWARSRLQDALNRRAE